MAGRPDNVEFEYKEEKHAPVETNHTVVDKMTRGLVNYLNDQKIVALAPLVTEIESRDAAFKLSFIRMHLCPNVRGLRSRVEELLKKEKVTLPSTVVDKVERFLVALCEVAEQ